MEKNIDWSSIVNEAISQRGKKQWILYNLEETMQKLKKIAFIKKEHFDKIYEAENKFIKKK